MKFKVALQIVDHQIFEVEAPNAEVIRKHWSDHELRKVPDCDCQITLGICLETEMKSWKILDLHEVKANHARTIEE